MSSKARQALRARGAKSVCTLHDQSLPSVKPAARAWCRKEVCISNLLMAPACERAAKTYMPGVLALQAHHPFLVSGGYLCFAMALGGHCFARIVQTFD
eukprot:scaffold21596_cov20-Tisochrysis_lutea.AAC.1